MTIILYGIRIFFFQIILILFIYYSMYIFIYIYIIHISIRYIYTHYGKSIEIHINKTFTVPGNCS